MTEPIRVAQILNRMDSGGIEAVVMNYYRNIDRSKVQFDFYLAEDSIFPQEQELRQLGAGIYKIPAYTKVVSYQKALQSAFRQRQYAIVHAHLSTMSVFPLLAAWRAGVSVRICHNHSTADWGEGKKTLLKYLLRPFNKIFATHWFACGERAGRWMYGDSAFESGRVTVLPNAIDTARFVYDPGARQRLRKELDIPQDAFVVGHIGRFVYPKNHDYLVRLFAAFARQHPEAYLLLVGEGELYDNIIQQVRQLEIEKNVIFTGARRDADKLYSAMDVFCLPSFYEGMPVVAWEAQANGLPCLFADTMTSEVRCADNAVQLPIGAEDMPLWLDKMANAHRAGGAAVKDIHDEAKKLQEFYLER